MSDKSRSPKYWDGSHDDTIKELYTSGKSARFIARQLGASYQYVLHRLHQLNIVRSDYSVRNEFRKVPKPPRVPKPRRKLPNKFEDTYPERCVKSLLDELGLSYESQYKIGKFNHKYDLYIPSLNLLVEVDGEWSHSSEIAKRRDSVVDFCAMKLGYGITRITDKELNLESVKYHIYNPITEFKISDEDKELTLIHLNSGKDFYCTSIFKKKMPIQVHVIKYGKEHWHYNHSVTFEDVVNKALSYPYRYQEILKEYGLSRNWLIRLCAENGLSIHTFTARYCRVEGSECYNTVLARLDEGDLGNSKHCDYSRSLLISRLKDSNGIYDVCSKFGRSRNYVIRLYCIAFNLSWNDSRNLLDSRGNFDQEVLSAFIKSN